eukprot:TRINITY_DN38112_c0_g1_i2.p1 TRINITY_DN38112_c0_g1~~TRINITY_DN38112_c0_g1_i2.p1  ORF type:complete len:121 (+),score=40.38 TRINITY_DN38112_c0_g1_i2:133-495(+)
MLRSLVGSEMCIRDRAHTALEERQQVLLMELEQANLSIERSEHVMLEEAEAELRSCEAGLRGWSPAAEGHAQAVISKCSHILDRSAVVDPQLRVEFDQSQPALMQAIEVLGQVRSTRTTA